MFLTCFYMFLRVPICFGMFLTCFYVPTCFCMFLYVSNMFLYVSTSFCMFLYVSNMFLYVSPCFYLFPVAPSFVLGSNPKFQGCFPLISGSHWSRERAAYPCLLSLSLCFPQPPAHPKNSSPTSGSRVQQGGDTGRERNLWGM